MTAEVGDSLAAGPRPSPPHVTPVQIIGKIRGGFNNLERQLERLDKDHREVEAAPSKLN